MWLSITKALNELIRLLKRDWRYFLWVSLFLVLGVGIGLNLPKHNPLTELIIKSAMQKFAGIKQLFSHASLLGKIVIIWCNNIFASAASIACGILFIFPAVILIENGAIIGLFQKLVTVKTGLAPIWFYLSLAPHGIFELPAFIIASALGIRFGLIPWRLLYDHLRHRANRTLFQEFFQDMRYYAVFLLFILLIAAVLEVTVSPLLIRTLGTKLHNI